MSSHNVTEIGELCDKAMLLHKGEVIFAKDIDDVREGFEKVQIALPEGELDRSAIENAGVEVLSFVNENLFKCERDKLQNGRGDSGKLCGDIRFFALCHHGGNSSKVSETEYFDACVFKTDSE